MSLRIRRGAFTLIELLVAMSVVVVLSALTLAVLANMGERDGTTDAAGLTRQWFMIAKNRAARDRANRGLQLVVGLDPNNPGKTNNQWVTELQYIEQPPAFVPTNGYPPGSPQATCVKIVYTITMGSAGSPECWIENLTAADLALVQSSIPGGLIVLNDLRNGADTGPYSGRMMSQVPSLAPPNNNPSNSPFAAGTFRLKVNLDSYPDASLGAAGVPGQQAVVTSYSFGITPPPQPIVGEPPLQLSKGICIDLTASNVTQNGGNNINILFTPTGHVVPWGGGAGIDGMIHLWHRDYTKLPGLGSPLTVIGPGPTYDLNPFQNGGVQQLVSIRCKTGALGQFPVMWPNGSGQYAAGTDAYTFARNGASSP